jgi:hypothetical protein
MSTEQGCTKFAPEVAAVKFPLQGQHDVDPIFMCDLKILQALTSPKAHLAPGPHRPKIPAPLLARPQPFGRALRFRPGPDKARLPGCGQAIRGAVC